MAGCDGTIVTAGADARAAGPAVGAAAGDAGGCEATGTAGAGEVR
jgi:hypothetical protein